MTDELADTRAACDEAEAVVTTAAVDSSCGGASTGKARAIAGGQVDRVVAGAVPEGMHLARNARLALQKAATVSVLYLACLADDARQHASRRRMTLSAQDVHDAVIAAGMAHLLPSMRTAAKRAREEH